MYATRPPVNRSTARRLASTQARLRNCRSLGTGTTVTSRLPLPSAVGPTANQASYLSQLGSSSDPNLRRVASDLQAGVSIDQVLAKEIGHLTRFRSLELSCDYNRKAGACDSGYSCAYQYNIAWRTATSPMPP